VGVWELRCASINDFAMLVSSDPGDGRSGMFDANGKALDWMHRPAVEFYVEPRKKVQKPHADVSLFRPGALVLNAKAKLALGAFLSNFGQLLELHHGSETLWFYNVTNMVSCVDADRSEKRRSGAIAVEAFDGTNVPVDAAVFKDPLMAQIRIYVNDGGKALIEKIAFEAGLTGIECGLPQRF
jgi:hypothetical protein